MSTGTVAIHGCAMQAPAKPAAYRPAPSRAETCQNRNAIHGSSTIAGGILNWWQLTIHNYQTNRRRRASYRVMSTLPESILRDIGWPNIVDQLDRQEISSK